MGELSVLPLPLADFRAAVKAAVWLKWAGCWGSRGDCRQTKIWFPWPNPGKSMHLLCLGRQDLSVMVQFLTGHNYLNYHHSKIHSDTSPKCKLCHTPGVGTGEDETV